MPKHATMLLSEMPRWLCSKCNQRNPKTLRFCQCCKAWNTHTRKTRRGGKRYAHAARPTELKVVYEEVDDEYINNDTDDAEFDDEDNTEDEFSCDNSYKICGLTSNDIELDDAAIDETIGLALLPSKLLELDGPPPHTCIWCGELFNMESMSFWCLRCQQNMTSHRNVYWSALSA